MQQLLFLSRRHRAGYPRCFSPHTKTCFYFRKSAHHIWWRGGRSMKSCPERSLNALEIATIQQHFAGNDPRTLKENLHARQQAMKYAREF